MLTDGKTLLWQPNLNDTADLIITECLKMNLIIHSNRMSICQVTHNIDQIIRKITQLKSV